MTFAEGLELIVFGLVIAILVSGAGYAFTHFMTEMWKEIFDDEKRPR